MADTISTPAGTFPKKGVLIVLGITAGIVGYAYWRHRNAAPADNAVPVDTAGAAFDPNAIDPNTGLTYAQEGGVQGQAYQYGYNPYNQSGGSTPTPVATQQYADNASWAQAAQDYLVNNAGADPATVSDALGKYITGQPLTTGQQGVVSSAIAFVNYPPVSGVDGKPPAMNIAGSTTQPGPPPPPAPKAANPVSALRISDRGYTSVTIDWKSDHNAKSYLVTVDHGGSQVQREQVAASVDRIGNLKRRTKYDIRVWAQPGKTGQHPAHITVTTK